MATVKGVYDLIKADQKAGKPLSEIEIAIINAVENENIEKTTKEVDVSFVKNKNENQNTRQPTQDQVKQEE
tara:strand:- start:160 stop:372 length:213 start_codon:yes stop_codon:yes gene_type:complete